MRLPEHAVHRPVLTSMFFLGLLLLGAVSFTRLEIDLLPELDFPAISVVTTYEGAGPEEIETLITRPTEQALSTVEGIDRIESFSAEGRSRVALRFVWGTNLDTALNDVRAAVERVKSRLPEDAESPVVYKFNLSSFPILYLALSGSLDEPALRQLAEMELGPRLERVEGVARVDVRGGLKREIHILLDPVKLQSLGVTGQQVVAALETQNRNVPAGQVEAFDDNILVRSIGEAADPTDFLDVVVDVRRDSEARLQPIRVRDVARVMDTFEDPSSIVHINGEPGIRLSVSKQSGANTVAVADRAIAEIERMNRDYQGRATLHVMDDTSEYIEKSISNVQDAVLIGAGLAVLVLLFFLHSLRPTFIVALAIPISIIGMFTLMYATDITLNLVSFGGVALGIGLLVDNAIVILENIFKKLEAGEKPIPAAVEGSREVATAIVASTLTTLAVFAPVIFLTGFASIFFGQMAFVVSFALVASLAVALTLIPMLASRFLRAGESKWAIARGIERVLHGVEGGYDRFVRACLAHPVVTLLVALAMLGGSFTLVPYVGTELLPEDDQSEVRVDVDLPVGTRIEVTEEAMRRIEARVVDAVPEMVSMQTTVGTPGFWSTAGEESGGVEIKLVPPAERERSSEEVAQALRPAIKGLVAGADVRVRAGGGLWILRMLRGGGERLEVQVRGYDLDTADRLAAEAKEALESTEGVTAAVVSRKEGGRELRVVPDRARLADVGLTPDAVSDAIQTYVQGTRATVLRSQGDEFDVLVKLSDAHRAGIETFLDVPVLMPGGGHTELRDLVRVDEVEGPLTIERENQSRVVYVRGVLAGTRDLGSIASELRSRIGDMDVPDAFSVLVKGETQEQEETFRSLVVGILLAVLLVYMVMASQFESFLHPLYIMFSIPFAAIGVIVALWLTDTTFNIQSFMGGIVLTGIVVNNAIVLVDYVNLMRRDHAMSVHEAVVHSARRRLRPILMTTTTTMLALVPVAIGMGEGGETQAPLARAVIGGLFVSSAISLVVIPVLYDTVEGWRERRRT
ncbi:MAG: efflux RND transporter permease subunit [Myxococcota bacterium]